MRSKFPFTGIGSALDVYQGELTCSYCGGKKPRMTVWRHLPPRATWSSIAKGHVDVPLDLVLRLCFHGCQFFPEPFKAAGCSAPEHWERIDPWKTPGRKQPRLHKDQGDWRALREMGEDHQQP